MAKHVKPTPSNTAPRGRAYVTVSWLLVVAWAAVIFFMSAHTGQALSSGFFGMVKEWAEGLLNSIFGYHEDPLSPICHFMEYLVLGVLLCNALGCHTRATKAVVLAVICASAYGITDEFHQIFVDGRVCDPLDWATDTAGAVLGSTMWLLIKRLRSN